MNFANPAAFLGALPVAGVILLLYLLKMRRRDLRVPATFLWPARTEEVRANSLFQKLRPSWLLFLQLLALACLTLILARPQIRQQGMVGEVTVIVLDASASMGARDAKPNRFEVARQRAKDAILATRPGDRIALIEAGPSPRVAFPLGNDPGRQIQALNEVQLSDAESDIGEALRLATAITANRPGARILLFSDGNFAPITDFARGKAALVYQSVGTLGDNLGVSALGVTDSTQGRQLFVGVTNYGKVAMEAAVSLYGDGKLIDSITTGPIAPGSQWGKALEIGADLQVLEAKLDGKDLLAADDYAATVAGSGASLRVLLVGPPDPFTERALALDPRVTLDRTDKLPAEERGAPGGSKYDIVVFDGAEEVPVKARGVLTLGGASSTSPAQSRGNAKAPEFVSAIASPITKGVDFRGVFIDRQAQLEPAARTEVLAETSAGPLLVSRSEPGRRQLQLAFAPLDSDFPLQVAFPIFIANALDYLAGGQSQSTLAVRAGVPFTVPGSENADLVAPDEHRTTQKSNGATVMVRDIRKVGRYELKAGETTKSIFAYLRNDRESTIAPVTQLSIGGGQVAASSSPLTLGDFWRPIALLALLVLAGEWWLYARRS